MESVKHEQMLALEHSTLKVPCEKVSRIARNGLGMLEQGLEEVIQDLDVSNHDGVRNVVEKLNSLKRKMDATFSEGSAALEHVAKRGALLEGHDKDIVNWRQTRLNRFVVEHLQRQGHFEAASLIAPGEIDYMKVMTNENLFQELVYIEDSLTQQRTCVKALAWCKEHDTKLTRLKSTLAFRLLLQQFVELVRSGNRVDAVAYAAEHLKPFCLTQSNEIRRAMGLLALPVNKVPWSAHHQALLSDDTWVNLGKLFHRNFLVLHGLSANSLLSVAVQSGISALKTRVCGPAVKSECPICDPTMHVMAESLPRAHHVNSKLVCSISGEALDENNPPLVLPNGMVYGTRGLYESEPASKVSLAGMVYCPRTEVYYKKEEVERVFIV